MTLLMIGKDQLNFLWPINWYGLHHQYLMEGEMEVIAALLREVEAKSMMEIGCRDGRTAKVLLHNVTALQRYLGVDVPMSYIPALDHQRSEMYPHPGALAVDEPMFELIIRERGSLDLMPADLSPVDAVFIDGDHSSRVVEHDARLAYAIAQKLIIFHDAFNSNVEVMRVLDKLADEGWPLRVVEGTWLAFFKR